MRLLGFLSSIAMLAACPAAFAASDPAEGPPGRESFQMGRFSFTALRPTAGNYKVLSILSQDGIDTERFELTAQKGRFTYYSAEAGPARRVLMKGLVRELKVTGLKRNRTVSDVPPLFELEKTDAMTFILELEKGDGPLVVSDLFGGRLEVEQRKVWVGNDGQVRITPVSASGSVRFRAASVTWKGLRLRLPEPLGDVTLEARPTDPGLGAELKLDFDTGELVLASGAFGWKTGKPWSSAAGMTAKALRLSVGPEYVGVDLQGVSVPAQALRLGESAGAPVVTPGTFSFTRLAGQARREAQPLGQLTALRTEGTSLSAPALGTSADAVESQPLVQQAIAAGVVTGRETARKAAIAETSAALAAMSRLDFAAHVPAAALERAFAEVVSKLGEGVTTDLKLGPQEVRLGVRIEVPVLGTKLPVALALNVALSTNGTAAVLRPSVEVALPGSFALGGPTELVELVAKLRGAVSEAVAKAGSLEARIPLDLAVVKHLDPSTVAPASPNLTLGGNAVDARLSIPRAALLVDEAGVHVAGQLEVSL